MRKLHRNVVLPHADCYEVEVSLHLYGAAILKQKKLVHV